MSDLIQDVRLGLRVLLKTPLVSLLATLSLALAISGNTTVFSMVDAILLRPPPFPNPDTLVMLWEANRANPVIDINRTSADNFLDFKEDTAAFEQLSALLPASLALTEGDRPEPLTGWAVSPGFFEITCSFSGSGFRRSATRSRGKGKVHAGVAATNGIVARRASRQRGGRDWHSAGARRLSNGRAAPGGA